MKRLCLLILLLFAVSSLAIALATLPAAAQTSTTAWPFYVELNGATGAPGLYDLIVPFHVMDKSLDDLSDLLGVDRLDERVVFRADAGLIFRRELLPARAAARGRAEGESSHGDSHCCSHRDFEPPDCIGHRFRDDVRFVAL